VAYSAKTIANTLANTIERDMQRHGVSIPDLKHDLTGNFQFSGMSGLQTWSITIT